MRPTPDDSPGLPFLRDSEMATRFRAFDWASSPLGPTSGWPATLRAAVGICLNSRFPMFVWWGPDLINIHNDAYIPVLGKRHPDALGMPARRIWADIWPDIGADVEGVIRNGEPVVKQRVRFLMHRNGYEEETFFSYSHSPIPDDHGGIGGLFQVCTDETELVHAERRELQLAHQRREAEDRAHIILESITDAFFALDSEWRFTYLNPQAERLLEKHPSELLGQVLWDVYPGLIGSEFERIYRTVARTKNPQSITSFYPDHDRWYEVHAYPVGSGVSLYFRDVSQRHRVELERQSLAQQLAEKSRLFDRVLTSISDFAYTFDLEGRFTFVNKPLLDLWGIPLEQAVGRNFFDLHYPRELAAKLQSQIRQVIDTGDRVVDHTPYTNAAGHSGEYQYIFTPVLGADGSVEAVAGSTRDITALRETEEAVRRSESRYRGIFDQLISGIAETDATGRLRIVNDRFCQMVGYARDELLSRRMQDITHPDDLPRNLELIAQAARTGEPFQIEKRYVRKDGSAIWVHNSVAALRDDAGVLRGLLAVSVDISDRRRSDAEREVLLASERAARAEAERAGRLKDEFLATLSHELRTPLAAVLGWTQLLRKKPPDAETLTQGLAVIERNARMQAQLVTDLLDMSRIISGKMRLDVQQVELPVVIDAALDSVRPAAEARDVRLQSIIEPLTCTIHGDAARLQQVVWNLLSNAVKFTPRGGRVHIVLSRADSHVELRVSDTGRGIRPEFLPHVFERFRQADSSTAREHGGLGLGLAIVKQLVELHGGSVHAASDGVGLGSTFTVHLPIAAVQVRSPGPSRTEHPTAPTFGPAATGTADLAGVRVLVVDDEPDARELVRRVLAECNAEVILAASAAEAIAAAQRELLHVIVSDIGLPGQDGYALMRVIRGMGSRVPAAALTAFARTEDRTRALSAGYQTHIAKPVEPAELVATVAALVHKSHGDEPRKGS